MPPVCCAGIRKGSQDDIFREFLNPNCSNAKYFNVSLILRLFVATLTVISVDGEHLRYRDPLKKKKRKSMDFSNNTYLSVFHLVEPILRRDRSKKCCVTMATSRVDAETQLAARLQLSRERGVSEGASLAKPFPAFIPEQKMMGRLVPIRAERRAAVFLSVVTDSMCRNADKTSQCAILCKTKKRKCHIVLHAHCEVSFSCWFNAISQ